jgi:ParB/RepB/Spo0J family partition protein
VSELVDEAVGEDFETEVGLDLTGLVPTETRNGNVGFQMISVKEIEGAEEGDPPSKAFLESVETHGFYQPILVRPTGRKKQPYALIAGRRRLKAARQLGIDQIPAMIEERESVNSDIAALAENFQRSENVIGDAKIVWRLLDDGIDEKKIASSSGLKLVQVRALRDMRKLRPELIEAIENGQMRPWSARMAARLPDAAQQRLIDILEENGQVTSDDVVNVRKVRQGQATAELGGIIDEFPDDTEYQDEREARAPYATEAEDEFDRYEEDDEDEEDGGRLGNEKHVKAAIRYLGVALGELAHVRRFSSDWDGAARLVEDALTTLRESPA